MNFNITRLIRNKIGGDEVEGSYGSRTTFLLKKKIDEEKHCRNQSSIHDKKIF